MFRPLNRVRGSLIDVNRGRSSVLFARALLAALALVLLLPLQSQSQSADYQIPGGWFYTQTGGDTSDPLDGYAVVDDPRARFWTAFVDLGGIQAVGYPVTQRFMWDGFVTQVFQKAAFQWRADTGKVEFINVFDDLNRLGFDDALEARLIPRQEQFDETGLGFDAIAARRIELLDAEPALRASYESVDDPIRWYGLPQSRVREFGDGLLRSIRLQRAVLQLWTEDVPWARAGTVTIANGGEEAKALGLWPAHAAKPDRPPAYVTETAAREGSARLLWEHPLPENDYPYSSYRVVLDEGVAIVRVGDSEIRALDLLTGQFLWGIADSRVRSNFKFEVLDGVVYLRRYGEPGLSEIYANRGLTPTTDVVAVDIRTGEKIWQFWEIASQWFQRFHIWQDHLAIESDPRIGLDSRTGKKLWENRAPGFANYASDGVLFFERLELVTAVDMASGATLWQKQLSGLNQVRGASAGNLFTQTGSSVVALDVFTGKRNWSYQVPGRDLGIDFLADGFVVVSTHTPPPPSPYATPIDPEGFCVLEPATGTALWCRQFDGGRTRVWPAAGGLRLDYEDRVALLDVGSGAELWSRDKATDGDRRNPQAIGRANAIYELVDGQIAVYAGDSDSPLWRYSWVGAVDPADREDDPLLMTAAGNIVIIWTGSGLAAVGFA